MILFGFFNSKITSKMDNDCDGYVGRVDGVYDAWLSEHNNDSDGDACGIEHQKSTFGYLSYTRGSEDEQRDYVRGFRLQRSVRVGRRDSGYDNVRVLLRVHYHPHSGWLAGTKFWRQIHHGLCVIIHIHTNAADAHRCTYGINASDGIAFHRRIRRSNLNRLNILFLNLILIMINIKRVFDNVYDPSTVWSPIIT